MIETELAWAAGFFDGEGWVGFSMRTNNNPSRRRFRRLEVGIGQTDPEVLERFRKAVDGLGTIKGPYRPDPRGGRKPRWYFNAAGKPHVVAIYELLEPYLSSIKLQQFRSALTAYESAPVSTGSDER